MAVELSAVETREEHARNPDSTLSEMVNQVRQITGGHQVVSKTIESSYGCGHQGWSIDNGTRNQAK